jgi:tRNA(fMet)-specific endonuclease VapC
VQRLEDELFLSIVSVVELEGGITRNPDSAATRRLLLDEMLEILSILPFGKREASEYGRIVAKIGFSRSRILDRMIAAQAIVTGATLVTMNGDDFRDIPGLSLEIWPSPHA